MGESSGHMYLTKNALYPIPTQGIDWTGSQSPQSSSRGRIHNNPTEQKTHPCRVCAPAHIGSTPVGLFMSAGCSVVSVLVAVRLAAECLERADMAALRLMHSGRGPVTGLNRCRVRSHQSSLRGERNGRKMPYLVIRKTLRYH